MKQVIIIFIFLFALNCQEITKDLIDDLIKPNILEYPNFNKIVRKITGTLPK